MYVADSTNTIVDGNVLAAASQTKDAIGSVVDKSKQTVPEKDVVTDVDTSVDQPKADVTIVQKPVQETDVVKDVGTFGDPSDSSDEETGSDEENSTEVEEGSLCLKQVIKLCHLMKKWLILKRICMRLLCLLVRRDRV